MANNMNGFLLDGQGPEQNYGEYVGGGSDDTLQQLLSDARDNGLELVSVWEAEGSCVAIVPRRVAPFLLAWLNSDADPLEPLSYIGDKLPQEVIDIRQENRAAALSRLTTLIIESLKFQR